MYRNSVKDAAPVNKLKGCLSAVVVLYLLYAMVKDGVTPLLLIILAAAILVGAMQLWMHTASYKKYKDAQQRMNKR